MVSWELNSVRKTQGLFTCRKDPKNLMLASGGIRMGVPLKSACVKMNTRFRGFQLDLLALRSLCVTVIPTATDCTHVITTEERDPADPVAPRTRLCCSHVIFTSTRSDREESSIHVCYHYSWCVVSAVTIQFPQIKAGSLMHEAPRFHSFPRCTKMETPYPWVPDCFYFEADA